MKSTQKRTVVFVNTVDKNSPTTLGEQRGYREDTLAVEEPLEIILGYGEVNHRQHKTIAVTMRTPDNDCELALGFLYTEGVIFHKKDVKAVRLVAENRILVDIDDKMKVDIETLNRHFYTTSSCGVCGKTSLEAVVKTACFILEKNRPQISQNVLFQLPDKLLAVQQFFIETGGVQASGLFDTVQRTPYARKDSFGGEGRLLKVFEDVGRHNALDKLIGWAFQQDMLPLKDKVLLVSGRASFELVQKAVMAGIPIVAAVGAPSSLAVELAEENNITLIGFLKKDKFNVYTGIERVVYNRATAQSGGTD